MKVHKQLLVASLVFAIGGISSATQAGIISVFDGVGGLRSDWEAEVGAYMEEDFAGGVPKDFSVAITGGGHNGFAGGDHNGFSINGVVIDRLAPGSGSSMTITFDFAIFAFGGNWDLSPGGAGRGIQVNAGGVLIPIEIPDTHAGEFFGFTSDVGFMSLVLSAGNQGGAPESYTADNFVYTALALPAPVAVQAAVQVLEPGTLALLVLGVLGIGFGRLRR